MKSYDHKKIEKKWQKYWDARELYKAHDDSPKPKLYTLIEFPYPSGAGLHVGHPRPYTAMDVISRKKRMEGYNVLYPIGWDAFGLPTENYAIKTGQPPQKVTKENIATFKRQIKSLGISFDWSREVNTTDPAYYKWTQWIFLQLFKHNLAYKAKIPINWCVNCKISLANEEVVGGVCERCGGHVEKRLKDQWMLAITKYADKLLEGLKDVDYIPQARTQQENWIGRSEGAEISFKVANSNVVIKVFTTRPDTLFGATYMVLAPEHPLIQQLKDRIENWKEVDAYVRAAQRKSDLERTELQKEKTGVELCGIRAVNPANGAEIPVWVADYVLGGYGTGAIMAVPAHDNRDLVFSMRYGLSKKLVVIPHELHYVNDSQEHKVLFYPNDRNQIIEKFSSTHPCLFEEEGVAINSDFLDGLTTAEAKEKIIAWLEEKGVGARKVQYKLRDWVFSRQRYWGEPIPLVYCEACAHKKYTYVIIHGFNGSSRGGWKPWIQKQLEQQGHTVFCPDLPHASKPHIDEQVQYILDHTVIDEHTILVGHSLGGAVLMRLLEKINIKIARAVFVDCFMRPEFTDARRPLVETSCNWKFDFQKIKQSAREFVILGDARFPIIQKEQLYEMKKIFDAPLILTIPNSKHFSEATIEPEVLKLLQTTGWVPLPESELPLKLPAVKKYEPTDTGESPLAGMDKWVNTTCPRCGGPARRETDTMPNWAGSSWYFLRYTDPRNDKEFASMDKLKKWMPVDWYNGGMEHTVLHLLYSRFWNEFLYDIGAVPVREPYKKRTSHGMILAKGGEKMSKSKGNVVNPDDIVNQYGADTMRAYIMFMGPFDQAVEWDPQSLVGVHRFLERVWTMQERVAERAEYPTDIERLVHQTVKKIGDCIEAMNLNTPVAQLMTLSNALYKLEKVPRAAYEALLIMLSLYAPHICEELWEALGHTESITLEKWPSYNSALLQAEQFELVIQINGKVRDKYMIASDILEVQLRKDILARPKVQMYLQGAEIKQFRYIPGKLVSIVV